ncbi:MAG: hypothetical protein RBU30_26505 [Polyangia bacterium]|nr:hypothetical protein [Polyangia bacterium]
MTRDALGAQDPAVVPETHVTPEDRRSTEPAAGRASSGEEPGAPSPRPAFWRRRPITLAALLACAASAAASFIPGVPFWLGAALVLCLGLPLLLGVVWEWSGSLPSRPAAALFFAAASLAWALSSLGVRAGWPWWLLHPASSAALVAMTLVVGNWLAGELERPGHLLPVCVIGALADLWSVLSGPTRQIGERTAAHLEQASAELARGGAPPPPPWPSFLVFHWPQVGGGGMASLVGFGDLVFLALLLAGARRFGLGAGRALGLVASGLCLAMGLSLALGRPLPALPFLCGLFVLGNLPWLRLTRREWWITAAAAVLLGGLLLLSFP